ncbi:MAG TPA: peptide chain release factor N(5)-glutamine methyltransferase [Vicinamibacterales bacterium]|jgi:release factor glutamine methyltransferase|nr:peptide chain release factor N(5)-glutamine methyltransferase [Vicinamibacterales bacterium]
MAGTSFADVVARGREQLVAAGIPEDQARLDAELLARHALGWDRAVWLASRRDEAPDPFLSEYAGLLARRLAREPVSLITGAREFWGLQFDTRPGVLIPRFETELIVEEALDQLARVEAPRIADIGTGSGCLAVALAHELPRARVVATDLSALALDVARSNAKKHGVTDRVRFVLTDMLDGIGDSFDVIVSNPPYVQSGDREGLAPEVRDHEPALALFGGTDGLDAIRAVVARTPARLAPGGRLIIEFGYDQDERVCAIAQNGGLTVLRIRDDLQGIPRVAVLTR